MRYTTYCLLTALTLSGCISVSEPTIQKGPDAEIILGGLHRVDNSRVALSYVDPNADFSRYSRVIVDPLGVDNVEIIKPNMRNSASNRARNANWELSDADKAKLREAFAASMRTQLEEKGDYPLVGQADDDVLRVTAVLTALAPTAPPDDFQSRSLGRGRVYTEGGGTVYITISFSDSESGEILALVKDEKSNSAMWGVNNSVSNMGDVKFMFNSWAKMIRARLDIIHGH